MRAREAGASGRDATGAPQVMTGDRLSGAGNPGTGCALLQALCTAGEKIDGPEPQFLDRVAQNPPALHLMRQIVGKVRRPYPENALLNC